MLIIRTLFFFAPLFHRFCLKLAVKQSQTQTKWRTRAQTWNICLHPPQSRTHHCFALPPKTHKVHSELCRETEGAWIMKCNPWPPSRAERRQKCFSLITHLLLSHHCSRWFQTGGFYSFISCKRVKKSKRHSPKVPPEGCQHLFF